MRGVAWILLLGVALGGAWELARERRPEGEVQDPSAEQRARYAALVRALGRAAPAATLPPDAEARAAELGLELRREGDQLWLLERAEPLPGLGLRGVGVLGLRLGPLPAELVLQAPHPSSDLHTGPLASALFDAGGVRAVQLATTHRDAGEGADPAHNPASWFQGATDGLADALADPLVVQLHGFSRDTSEADAVLSEGATPLPPAELAAMIRRFSAAMGLDDVRDGTQVPALAGRDNAQARLLAGRARFLHLEMSLPLRVALRDEAERRAALSALLRSLAARQETLP